MSAIRTLGGFTSIASILSRLLPNLHLHEPFGHFLRLSLSFPKSFEPNCRCWASRVSASPDFFFRIVVFLLSGSHLNIHLR